MSDINGVPPVLFNAISTADSLAIARYDHLMGRIKIVAGLVLLTGTVAVSYYAFRAYKGWQHSGATLSDEQKLLKCRLLITDAETSEASSEAAEFLQQAEELLNTVSGPFHGLRSDLVRSQLAYALTSAGSDRFAPVALGINDASILLETAEQIRPNAQASTDQLSQLYIRAGELALAGWAKRESRSASDIKFKFEEHIELLLKIARGCQELGAIQEGGQFIDEAKKQLARLDDGFSRLRSELRLFECLSEQEDRQVLLEAMMQHVARMEPKKQVSAQFILARAFQKMNQIKLMDAALFSVETSLRTEPKVYGRGHSAFVGLLGGVGESSKYCNFAVEAFCSEILEGEGLIAFKRAERLVSLAHLSREALRAAKEAVESSFKQQLLEADKKMALVAGLIEASRKLDIALADQGLNKLRELYLAHYPSLDEKVKLEMDMRLVKLLPGEVAKSYSAESSDQDGAVTYKKIMTLLQLAQWAGEEKKTFIDQARVLFEGITDPRWQELSALEIHKALLAIDPEQTRSWLEACEGTQAKRDAVIAGLGASILIASWLRPMQMLRAAPWLGMLFKGANVLGWV